LGALLAAVAGAEPDGAVAEPARWTGPNGPPSNSRRSRALPVTRDVVAAWTVALPGEAVAPPVTWDGTAFVACAVAGGIELVAVDMAKGVLAAKKTLPGAPKAPIHVWGGVAYVFTRPNQITGLRPISSTFVEKWKCALDNDASSMTVHENEVYVIGSGGLLRLAPGVKEPVWHDHSDFSGPAAIYGRSVLVIAKSARGSCIKSYDRSTGREIDSADFGTADAHWSHAVDITAGADHLLVRTPWHMRMEGGTATDGFVSYKLEGDQVTGLDTVGFMNFRIKPAVYKGGLIACERQGEWHWWQGDKGEVIAQRALAPDLFEDLVAPTVVGNVVYFGTWAADVGTGEILWRLPLRSVRFGIVPADRIFLAVDGEGRMHAFKSRVGR
jgi:hypothetical protein